MSTDYKNTLNLPKTGFPMKANLAQKEPEFVSFWLENKIYEKVVEKNREKERYLLHDGPPYANGHIHMGHALNKILKDIIVKYRSMSGFYSPYVPGWDCHGLPIELEVDKKLGSKKHTLTVPEKRKLCREYAEKFLNIQRDQFIRLGILGDWFNPYMTMNYAYQSSIIGEFYKTLKTGNVYRGKKPVHWCPSCTTALAEAEVEHAEKNSPSIYVGFKVLNDDAGKLITSVDQCDLHIMIWTTTPWTLPSNLALAVHPDIYYSVIKSDDNAHYIIAQALVEKVCESTGIKGEVVSKIKGAEIEGLKTAHPFEKRESHVVLADFVSTEEGTGIVHIAPGHGEDDYEVGLKYGLDIYAPVDDGGKFTAQAGKLEGKFVFKANDEIIEILKRENSLYGSNQITHSYPHCWRCKKPVIFRATEQWFISVEERGLRDKCINEIETVQWIPVWGKDRILGMMKNRPDWCISRQRAWGVPIAVFICVDCGEVVTDESVLNKIKDSFKEKSADVWFEDDKESYLPDGYKCAKCGSEKLKKEKDILDVWFDSGVSHEAVLEQSDHLSWPASIYLEGSDQHRGWFQSSLITSTCNRGKAPYNSVLTHGFVVDGKGKKMSKSVGNVIAPQDIIKKSGAEILRLWVSAEDYKDDVRLSNEIIQRLTEAYRKIRNTCRFLLGNISDFDHRDYSDSLPEIDRWAMSRLQNLTKRVTASYNNFAFHEVFHRLYNFCIVDMSSFYLDILKDRLYTYGQDSPERRASQWTMKQIIMTMTSLMAPVLSFTSEEIWKYMRAEMDGHNSDLEESVFLSPFPVVKEQFLDDELEKRWADLIKVRNVVNKSLELRRQEKFIGNSLEAKVILFVDGNFYNLLTEYKDFLPALFIVSQAELDTYKQFLTISEEERTGAFQSDDFPGLAVLIEKADGEKCGRCWNISTSVGTLSDYPDVCHRCHGVLT